MKRLIFFILFSTFLFAKVDWSLQVTDPDFELKHLDLDSKPFKPYLPKTSWRCYLSPVEKKNDLEIRQVRCNYSIQKLGEFKTFISCGKNKKYGEFQTELLDQKKNLTYKLRFGCRHTL